MEDAGDHRCCAVYYCPHPERDISQLFHRTSPPDTFAPASHGDTAWDHIRHNLTVLLDEDQGNFDSVFASSNSEKCLDGLESLANAGPAVIFIESSAGLDAVEKNYAFPFLQALATDMQGARFQHNVMPFVLVTTSPAADARRFFDASMTSAYLNAGATDIVKSPFTPLGLNRVIAHVRGLMRPSAHLLGAGMTRNLVDSIRDRSQPNIAMHRPDEFLSHERRAAVEAAITQWHFPAHDFDMDELTYGALFMLEHVLRNPDLEQYTLPRPELMSFLLSTRRQYKHEREVHYHNWRHAVDVTQSLYCFLCDVHLCPPADANTPTKKERNALEYLLTPMHALILLIAAIGHDVGHPGVNNAFLVACNHPLAHMYNDKSVLENYHCAAYSQLLRRHWPTLGGIPQFRTTMISTILATDMQRHFEYMGHLKDLKSKIDRSKPDLEDWNEKDRDNARELMMALLIKAADISNVARPFEVSARWAKILINEFSRQGELESELDIPTCLFGGPPNKDDILAAAQSQKGFMSLFGFPLFQGISEVMPNVSCSLPELNNNKAVWDQKIDQETRRREAGGNDDEFNLPPAISLPEPKVNDAAKHDRESEWAERPIDTPDGPSTPAKPRLVVAKQLSPARNPATDQKASSQGNPLTGAKRTSAPLLSVMASPLSPTASGASRRSSKDVALNHLQELSSAAQQTTQSESRRGSADASWQVHQSYPGSRRGSKDESLTTILFTSHANPSQKSLSGSSPVRSAGKPSSPSTKPGGASKRHSGSQPSPQKNSSGATRTSVPSSRSHATSSATATSDPSSPSTQPSSLAPTDDEPTPPAHHSSIAATEDPFLEPKDWPTPPDSTHRVSDPNLISNITPPPPTSSGTGQSDSPRLGSREGSGDSAEEQARLRARKSSHGVREARSRSRLRGLKFWKRRRDTGTEHSEGASPD